MTGWVTTCGMNWLQTLVSGVPCDRQTLLTMPWLMFLSAPVTPAEPWSLRTGRQHDLVDAAGDEEAEVRAAGALVLGIQPGHDELHDHELVGVIAGGVVEVARLLVVALDVDLLAVVGDAQPGPGDAVGKGLVHLGLEELVAIALEDDDVLGLDPGGLEAVDDLEHQLARGVGERPADRVHLDPDHVARLEEAPPGLDLVGGAGELLHAPRRRPSGSPGGP